MIETLEALQGLLLASLFNPALLAFFVAVFLLGKLVGYLTQNIRLWKILLLLYMSIFLFEPLRHSGPVIGGLFLLGFFSKHTGTIWNILFWARNAGDFIFALRYRRAFEDIRRREAELEAMARVLQEELRRQAYAQQQAGQKARAGWQEEARDFRGKKDTGQGQDHGRGSASGPSGSGAGSGSTGKAGGGQQSRSHTPPRESQREKYLRILGLDPKGSYSQAELKKAYRAAAKKTHPDVAGGSHAAFVAVQEAWEGLRG